MKNIAINVNSGHICLTDKQLTVYIHTITGCARMTLQALRSIKQTNQLPFLFAHQPNTQAARHQLAANISLCAARYEGKTGKYLGKPATAHNWNVVDA